MAQKQPARDEILRPVHTKCGRDQEPQRGGLTGAQGNALGINSSLVQALKQLCLKYIFRQW
jgi:hypothetical protein